MTSLFWMPFALGEGGSKTPFPFIDAIKAGQWEAAFKRMRDAKMAAYHAFNKAEDAKQKGSKPLSFEEQVKYQKRLSEERKKKMIEASSKILNEQDAEGNTVAHLVSSFQIPIWQLKNPHGSDKLDVLEFLTEPNYRNNLINKQTKWEMENLILEKKGEMERAKKELKSSRVAALQAQIKLIEENYNELGDDAVLDLNVRNKAGETPFTVALKKCHSLQPAGDAKVDFNQNKREQAKRILKTYASLGADVTSIIRDEKNQPLTLLDVALETKDPAFLLFAMEAYNKSNLGASEFVFKTWISSNRKAIEEQLNGKFVSLSTQQAVLAIIHNKVSPAPITPAPVEPDELPASKEGE